MSPGWSKLPFTAAQRVRSRGKWANAGASTHELNFIVISVVSKLVLNAKDASVLCCRRVKICITSLLRTTYDQESHFMRLSY